MDKQDIDEMFNMTSNEEIEDIISRITGIPAYKLNSNGEIDYAARLFGKKLIESDCYDYFLRMKDKNQSIFSFFLSYTGDEKEIKKYIQETNNIETDRLVSLVKETHDKTYIKNFLEAKKEELKLSSKETSELIIATKDQEYIKECIEKKDQLGLYGRSLNDLIVSTNDIEYMKQTIERRNKLCLSRIDEIIVKTHDNDYIKQCVERRDELNIYGKGLNNLIASTHDDDYIKQCIKRRKELEIHQGFVERLIASIDNVKYVENCLENLENIIGSKTFEREPLLQKIVLKDTAYIEKNLIENNTFGLNKNTIKLLIKRSNNMELIKKMIEKKDKYDINSEEIYNLAISLGKEKYFIEKGADFGLNREDTIRLLVKQEKEYINNWMKKTELTQDEKIFIALAKRDIDNLKRYIKIGDKKINLPEDLTIGIEIESVGKNSEIIHNMKKIMEWKCKEDGSIFDLNRNSENGVEVVSPILKGSNEERTNQIQTVVGIINLAKQYSNETCGGHIHFGADFLKDVQAYKNLLEIWGNSEELLYIISNRENDITRKNIREYAKPISGKLEEAINSETVNLENEEDLENLKKEIKVIQGTRYYGINFQNLGDSDKNTIEIRLPNGTVDQDTWIENVNLFGGVITISERLAEIKEKEEQDLNEDEKEKIEIFEKLKNNESDNKEKLKYLLELSIPNEESRQIYIKRYEINKELLEREENLKTYEGIKGNIAKDNIIITKKALADFQNKKALESNNDDYER